MIRGEIYMMDFGIPFGSEPGYRRPVLIIQADKENLMKMNTTVVIPLTSNVLRSEYLGNVFISKTESGLSKDSVAIVPHIIVVERGRLVEKIGEVRRNILKKIEIAIDYVVKND